MQVVNDTVVMRYVWQGGKTKDQRASFFFFFFFGRFSENNGVDKGRNYAGKQ